MDTWLLTILRCPLHPDAGPLTPLGSPDRAVGAPAPIDGLLCPVCCHAYPVLHGVPDMVGPAGCPVPDREAEAAQWDGQAPRYEEGRVADAAYMAGVVAAARALAP